MCTWLLIRLLLLFAYGGFPADFARARLHLLDCKREGLDMGFWYCPTLMARAGEIVGWLRCLHGRKELVSKRQTFRYGIVRL